MRRNIYVLMAVLALTLMACGGGSTQSESWDSGKWDTAKWQ